ncbi:MAG: hypothetical protein ACTTJ7_08360 [Treponema sp.]
MNIRSKLIFAFGICISVLLAVILWGASNTTKTTKAYLRTQLLTVSASALRHMRGELDSMSEQTTILATMMQSYQSIRL